MRFSHGPRVLGGVGVCQGAVEVGGGPGSSPRRAGVPPFPPCLLSSTQSSFCCFHILLFLSEKWV